MKYLLSVALAAFVLACTPAPTPPPAAEPSTAPAAPAAPIAAKPVIADAWAAATAEGVKVSAGYMTVTNPGAEDRIIAAASPAAGKTELHVMESENGVMKMRTAEGGVVAPAGGSVSFAPGGTHVMFLDLPAPLKDGTTIPVTLTFEKAGPVEVQFAVRPRTAADKPAEHKH
jgi:hypothetical protein